MATDLILGTAGHIDHGKTSLIRALTGVDTDRLPEERVRGITIELGFAHLDLGDFRLGIVDVPGHERFVRNMLAGATGMDLAMLVVAADDSVKPQTREHLDVLRLLDLPAGVIVLTKCDLADPEWIDLVEAEVRELVEGTFLSDAPMVRASVVSGEGIDELRDVLKVAARRSRQARDIADDNRLPFRMAIDRCFTMPGHGTVVTGSVTSGQVETGDQLVIQPGEIEVRVRGLQTHDKPVDTVHRGQRAAINLAGVHHGQIVRGHELASKEHLIPSRLVTVALSMLPDAPRPLKHRSRVRVHVGTAELMASVSLLNRDQVEPGQGAWAQLFLNSPSVSVWNQPFVLRSQSPVATIGGGRIMVPNAQKIRKTKPVMIENLEALASNNPGQRAAAALYFAGASGWDPKELTRTAGVNHVSDAYQQLKQSGILVEIQLSPRQTLRLHRSSLDEICQRIEAVLKKSHEREPLRSLLELSAFKSRIGYMGNDNLLTAIFDHMKWEGRIRLTERGIGLAGHGPKLSANEHKLLNRLIERFQEAGVQPPSIKECEQATSKNRESVKSLIHLAASNGDLQQINSEIFIHADTMEQLRSKIKEAMSSRGGGLTVSEIRELLGTSRKFAVPICEFLDQVGFTKRQGDVRVLAPAKTVS